MRRAKAGHPVWLAKGCLGVLRHFSGGNGQRPLTQTNKKYHRRSEELASLALAHPGSGLLDLWLTAGPRGMNRRAQAG